MRTAYGAIIRSLKREAPLGTELYRTAARAALDDARSIIVDPAQAIAAAHAIQDLAGIHQVAQLVRPPFPNTLLDFGTGVSTGNGSQRERSTLLGALFTHIGVEGATELLAVLGPQPEYIVYMNDTFFEEPRSTAEDLERHRRQLAAAEAKASPDPTVRKVNRELVDALRRLVATHEDLLEKRKEVKSLHERIEGDETFVKSLAAPFATLAMLESANVDLVESQVQYPKGHVAFGTPRLEILIRQAKRYPARTSGTTREFSHRFEVRGNFAHHYETTAEGAPNKLFEKWSLLRPEKIITVDDRPCIRIWRPPYIKGPEDKPLIIKERYLPRSQPMGGSA